MPSKERSRTPARSRSVSKARDGKDTEQKTPRASRSVSKPRQSTKKDVTQSTPAAHTPATNKKTDETELNPISTHFEFAGPYIGPIGITFGLPLLTWAYSYYCNSYGWPAIPSSNPAEQQAWTSLTVQSVWDAIVSTWDLQVFGVYVAYWSYFVLLYYILPGDVIEGTLLRNNTRLKYPMNGLASLLTTLAVAAGIQYYKPGGYSLSWIFDHFAQITTSTIVFCLIMSVFLYAKSFAKGALLAEGGNSKIPIYDFFIGRELNPRIFNNTLDLKFFNELRPGLTQWLLINLACAVKQYELTGSVSIGMLMVLTFEGYYVFDSVLNEPCILTTMDIIMDCFGFMFAFGDLAYVPALYSLQARYLATNNVPLSNLQVGLIMAIAILGMIIFRGANSQKDRFKRDPHAEEFKNFRTIKTHTGSLLLADGWWAKARHINYFGDWLMSVAWCLPTLTGGGFFLTYYYPLYFAILLIHRDARDNAKCQAKYGKAWDQYRALVPYRIIPYVY